MRRKRNLKFTGQLFYAGLIQAVASILIWAIMAAMAEKIINGNTLAWAALIGAQVVLLALLLVDGFELAEVIWTNERIENSNLTELDSAARCAESFHPCAVLQRTAAYGDRNAQCAGAAGLPEFRGYRRRQQHAGRSDMETP